MTVLSIFATGEETADRQLRDKKKCVETGRGGNRKLTWDGELPASSLGGLSSGGAELFCFLRRWTHTHRRKFDNVYVGPEL